MVATDGHLDHLAQINVGNKASGEGCHDPPKRQMSRGVRLRLSQVQPLPPDDTCFGSKGEVVTTKKC